MWEGNTRQHHRKDTMAEKKTTKEDIKDKATNEATPEVEATKATGAPKADKSPEITEALEVTEASEAIETTNDTKENFAKSGKRSKKHIEEVKAEEERQARKAEAPEAPKPKGATPITRPRIERRGKKYQAAAKLIDSTKVYSLKDAIDLAIKSKVVNFDATLEAHVRLGVDPRQADQNIRTTLVLPHGNGKTVRVAVFAPLDICKTAKSAGADIAEDEEFLRRLDKGTIDFDILISSPQYMPKLGKYARLLGPKGLMPNPKAGTVTTDIEKAVKEAKAGKVEYRVDKQSIVHIGLGKTSFTPQQILENAEAFLESLKNQKPASLKGTYVKSVYLTTTMGPSIQIENLYN